MSNPETYINLVNSESNEYNHIPLTNILKIVLKKENDEYYIKLYFINDTTMIIKSRNGDETLKQYQTITSKKSEFDLYRTSSSQNSLNNIISSEIEKQVKNLITGVGDTIKETNVRFEKIVEELTIKTNIMSTCSSEINKTLDTISKSTAILERIIDVEESVTENEAERNTEEL